MYAFPPFSGRRMTIRYRNANVVHFAKSLSQFTSGRAAEAFACSKFLRASSRVRPGAPLILAARGFTS